MRLLASCCAATYSCAFLPSLRFIGEQQLAHQLQYKESTVSGLSGIDYDVDTDTCILLSDERSRHNAARFYTATLDGSIWYVSEGDRRLGLNPFIRQATRQGEFISEPDLHYDPVVLLGAV